MANNEFSKLFDRISLRLTQMERRFEEKLEAEFVKHTNIVFGKLDQIMEEVKLYQQGLVTRRAQIERIKQHVGLEV